MSGPRFCQRHHIVEAFTPADSQSGATTSDIVYFKQYNHITFVYHKAVGTANDDPTITVMQTDGTTPKALTFTDIMRKEYVGAGLATIATFTHTTQAAANTYTHATSAESALLWVCEWDASDLDSDNGYNALYVTIADTGMAGVQLHSGLFILSEPHYAQDIMITGIS